MKILCAEMKNYAFYIMLMISINLSAQDIHFTQFFYSPLNINPALTAYIEDDYRVVANYRNQWRSVTINPYKTFSFSFDSKLSGKKKLNFPPGIGLLLNTDKAGDSNFGINQFLLCLALHKKLNPDSTMTISLGISTGLWQNTINYTNLYFGNQWNGYQYDPTISHSEIFPENKLTFWDITIGTNFYYFIDKNFSFITGLALAHLNKPGYSFFINDIIRIDTKLNYYIKADIRINNRVNFYPQILYLQQGELREMNLAGIVRYSLNDLVFQAVYFGGLLRIKDAFALQAGVNYYNIILNISYDFNFSGLIAASNGKGALEISLLYQFSKYKAIHIPHKVKCPDYL